MARQYDRIVHAYNEVSPLDPEEWEFLTPMWWAFLIECACQNFRNGMQDDGWVIKKLLVRSPLMGPDSDEFQ